MVHTAPTAHNLLAHCSGIKPVSSFTGSCTWGFPFCCPNVPSVGKVTGAFVKASSKQTQQFKALRLKPELGCTEELLIPLNGKSP